MALLVPNGDEPLPEPPRVARVPAPLGEGPLGSAPVPLEHWRYREDPKDRGLARGWADGQFGRREVAVPFSPNAERTSGPGAERGYRGSVGWYTRTIEAPVAGRYALSFASAHHDATVYVNGRQVRRHVGAYEPFTATSGLSAGRHTVSVRVDWRDPRAQSRAGYGRGRFNFGGLHGPVSLARTGPSALGALNVVTRMRSDGVAEVRVGVRVRNRGAARLVRPEGWLPSGSTRIPLPFAPVTIPADTSRSSLPPPASPAPSCGARSSRAATS